MGTKKQTVRNRFLAFAVVMVYVMALLPSFAFAAAPTNKNLVDATIGGKHLDLTTDAEITSSAPYNVDKKSDLVLVPKIGGKIVSTKIGTAAVVTRNETSKFTLPLAFADYSTPLVVEVVTDEVSVSKPQTYKFTLTMAGAQNDSSLSTLTVTKLDNDPLTWTGSAPSATATNTNTAFTATTEYATSAVKITATPTVDKNAKVKLFRVVGTVETDITADIANASLAVGPNVFKVVTTAEDGVVKSTDTITITRAAGQTTAVIDGIALSNATPDPTYTFNAATKDYTFKIGADETKVTFTPTLDAASNLAVVTVDGAKVASTATKDVTFNPGQKKTVKVVATSEDGKTQITYNYNITRPAKSDDATLKSLDVKNITLSPAFDSKTFDYTGKYAHSATKLYLKLAPNAANVKSLQVNGAAYTEITTPNDANLGYHEVNVTANSTPITIEVEAETGTTFTYNVDLTKADPSKDNSIKSISLSGAWTEGKFDPSVKEYNAKSTGANSIMMTVAANDPASIITVDNGTGATLITGNGIPTAISTPNDSTRIVVNVKAEDTTANIPDVTYVYTVTKDKAFAVPTNIRAIAKTETSVTLRFNEPKGMEKYAVYYRVKTPGNTEKFVAGSVVNKGTTDITVNNLAPSTNYEFVVTAGKTVNGKMAYVPLDGLRLTEEMTHAWFNPSALKVISTTKDSVTFAYDNIPGVESYAIYYAVDNSDKIQYGTKSSTGAPMTVKIANVDPSTTGYVFVLTTGKTVNGKMVYIPLEVAANTALQAVPTDLLGEVISNTPTLEDTENANVKNIMLDYVGVTGSESYAVYVSNEENGTYTYAGKTTNSNQIILRNVDITKAKFYKITDGKTVNGKMSYKALNKIEANPFIATP